jgi:hypothetical protein
MLLLGVTLIASCKKGYFYEGINDDPSQLQKPIPSNLLPSLIQTTGYAYGGDASRYAANFMQQVTGAANQSFSASRYAVAADDVDNMWTAGLYGGGIMNNANSLINIATEMKQGHYAALGQILMAFNLGLATDLWGDVPYTEAFKGAANLQPKYDTQEQIYTTLELLLNNAIASLGQSDGSPFQPGADDLLFYDEAAKKSDLEKWSRFAHSLKAKFYLHLAKKDKSYYDKALTEAVLGFKQGENAGVLFSGASVTSQGPWFQFNDQRGDISFTGHIYDIMATANDPRLAVYSDGEEGLGSMYGSDKGVRIYLMSYDELKFIEAECQFQRNAQDKAAAATAYNAANKGNLIRTINNDAYAATIEKTAGNITLADIMTQKYISLFLSPEVWTDWRRTGLPALVAPEGSALGGQLPRTLPYPSGEQRYNSNAPRNTSMLKRVWWDVQ